MNSSPYDEFRSPGNAWRGKPFWSWNGLLDKDELIRQIHVLRDMGMGGYFMHSRTGLATEYLGQEWFDLINACADEGARLGMESWLYDEDRWPSGTAGGRVTTNPEYRQKYLRCRPTPANEYQPVDGMIAAFATDLQGFQYSRSRRLHANERPDPNDMVLVFTVEEQYPSSFYNGQTYLDVINRDATEAFLQSTHAKYVEQCGERLGASIKGIFTDEPHRGPVMDGFSLSNPDREWLVPWTYKLFDTFNERFGYDLVERLPELYLWKDGQKVSPVKWHFIELLQQLFLENWAQPLDEYCRANRMVLTGHILHEDTLAAQTSVSGSVMRYYEHMEYPGVDVLTEGNRNFWVVKQLTSAARQLGQKWLLSELYGCTGWQMPFEGHKAVGDWQALFGINVRCHHLSWYTMEGEAKRDFPASIFHQSAWYKDYPYVEEYFARFGMMISRGKALCDVLVVNPVESVWCQVYPGWAHMLGARSPEVQELEKQYLNTFHTLLGSQMDFDYGDEEMLGRLGGVQDGQLSLGQAAYRVAVVSGMTTIRSTTLDKLEQFINAGGTVVFCGEPPAYVDAQPSERARELAARCVQTDMDGLVTACLQTAPLYVSVTDAATGKPCTDIFCQSRQDGDDRIVMLLNVNRTDWVRGARVHIAGNGVVEEWDCVTGERFTVLAEPHGDAMEFVVDFAPCGQKAYVLRSISIPEVPARAVLQETGNMELAGPFQYTLDEPNVLVLDTASYKIDDGAWQQTKEVLQVDRTIRDAFGLPYRGGEMLQPWFTRQQGVPELGTVQLCYEFHIDTLPDTDLELALERPDLWSVTVNDTQLDPASLGMWIDIAFHRLRVPLAALKPGANRILLSTRFTQQSNIEAVYLLGDFGVRVDGVRRAITRLPETLTIGDFAPQGLPFYSGSVRIGLPAIPAVETQRRYLCAPQWSAACLKVTAPGQPPAYIGWQPYETDITDHLATGQAELHLVLTRRNTFGPLHQIPLITAGYGPDNWLSFLAGPQAWTDSYQLIPQGLLAPVAISTRA